MKSKDPQQEEEKSFNEEVLDLFKDNLSKLSKWFRPDTKDRLVLQIVKSILKIPVLIVVVCLSPIALLFLLITFIAVL